MGLNPPFGLNAHLANKFVDKALTFKPKLLILIVPEETERLDIKNSQYDLVWEDRMCLSGKSFYLPGSIDVYDKQIEQWNCRPPVLYLWSRPDWTEKHANIALLQGHKSKVQSSFLTNKDSQPYSREDAPLADKNTEEMYKEKDPNQGERENMSLKEPQASESKREMKGSEKRESAPDRKDVSREAHKKKQHIEGRSEKKTAVQGEIDGHGKKRKSPETHKDNPKKKKTKEQQQQKKQGEELRDMSISPPSKGSSGFPSIQTPALGSVDRENVHGGYSGSGTAMINSSSIGRTSGLHEDPDNLSRRYSSPHALPGTELYGRDYSGPVPEERFRSLNTAEPYPPAQFARNGYANLDADLRMPSNSYGRMSERPQLRSYNMQGEETVNGYRRSAEPEFRALIRAYGEEDHPQATRFSLGSSVSSFGHTNMRASSAYAFSSPATDPSTMQRYAPRLDEMNHLRPRHVGPGIPFPGRDIPGFRRDNQPDSFSNSGSFGWIDE